MSPLRVLNIYGTRPEAIKMAPVIKEFHARREQFESFNCCTGQHLEMVRQVEAIFGITPDIELNVMRPNQGLSGLTSRLIEQLGEVVRKLKPDWIIAQGDTTTVLASAIVAFYEGVQFGHVEAGLRTGDLQRPFPEEFNRLVSDLVASLYFCPTERSADNLRAEGKREASILVTGNTVIDALQIAAEMEHDWASSPLASIGKSDPIVLITAHRRESFGETFAGICSAIRNLADKFPYIQFVYPVHLNPNVQAPVNEILHACDNVKLLPPLDYLSLIKLMKSATLVLTDSGGIQEEAPGLGIPVVVMRETTERPEGITAGVVKLAGTDPNSIVACVAGLLTNNAELQKMKSGENPYGDGNAAIRIADAILAKGTQQPD